MAVTPNTITVELDRSLQEVPTYKAWQASPLKVSCSFPSGSSDTLSDVTTLTLEIRTSRTTSDAAVCSKALSAPFNNAPWVFELDSADTNLTIPEDLEQAKFFMQVVATMDDGDLDVLAAGDLVVYDNNFDGASVDPPGTVTYASASFTTIAVSGQSNVVADSATDTLTLAAGNSSIVITTNASTDTVTFSLGSTITTTTVQASGSGGLMFHTSGGSDVLILGAGGGVNATAYGTWNFDGATANTIASFGASKGLTSLSTSTYPSLTEISYVKGVTSAIQTQINAKEPYGLVKLVSDTGVVTVYNPTSDTDAARGTALFNACSAATAGQTVRVSAGAYSLSGATVRLALADNVNLEMEDGAVITSDADLLTDGCVIYPGNNSVIRGGKIVCSGSSSQYAAAIGVVGDVFDNVRTGVQIIGVTMVGDTDCFYIQEDTGNCTAVLRDCTLISKWDNIVATSLSSGASHEVEVYNCRQIVTGPSATGSNQARALLSTFDSVIRVYGGSVECINGGTSINAGAYAKDGGTIEVHDVTFNCSNGVNPNYDLQIGTGGGTIKVSGGSGSGTAGGYLTSGTINYLDGKIGSANGLLKANGSGTVSAAVSGTDYLAPNGNGSSLTALNATQLTSGTIPDARFPATLPAASGANLTNLPAANVTGTLAVANGGTGAANSYGILRAGMHGPPVAYPPLWWTVSTISGTVTSGTQATAFYPYLQIATATNGQGRMSMNLGSGGPVWPGGDNIVDYDKKAVVRFRIVTQLSAHGDSKVAAHFAHTSPTTHTSYDRSVKGLSVVWVGGASAGTVYIQAHNGSSPTNSSTATFPINDVTGYNWTLEWEPGVAARLYRNGVLQCTLAIGLPSGTQGSSACGMVWLAGNTTNGTGNATLLRFMHADFLEVP